MIVVDASAAILALVNNGDARERLSSEPFAVPHLIDAEIANSLRMQSRRGLIAERDAARALDAWVRLGMQRVGALGLMSRVWELRENLTAYDAMYVALAEAFDGELLTADARLTRAPGVRCRTSLVHS